MSLLLLLGGAAGVAVAGERLRAYRTQPKKHTVSPSLVEALRPRKRILVSSGTIKRFALDRMSRSEVDAYVRQKYSANPTAWDEFSIDWLHPCFNPITGKYVHGQWTELDHDHTLTIYFYSWPKPPPPPEPKKPEPKPEAPTNWSPADEQHRRELYKANPLAFWLGPDFGAGWDHTPLPAPMTNREVTEELQHPYHNPQGRPVPVLYELLRKIRADAGVK